MNNKLYENPNAIYIDKIIQFDEVPTIVFSYYGNELFLGYGNNYTHVDLSYEYNKNDNKIIDNNEYDGEVSDEELAEILYTSEDDEITSEELSKIRGKHSGRIFINEKVITFWDFPETNDKLIEILTDINKKIQLNDFYTDFDEKESFTLDISDLDLLDDTWLIEVPKNKDLKDLTQDWGDWSPNEDTSEFLTIDEYEGNYKRDDLELAKAHNKYPIDKDIDVKNFGSKHPKYQEKEFWKRHTPFESNTNLFYPKLFETPDKVYYQDNMYLWHDLDAITFGYYNNKNFKEPPNDISQCKIAIGSGTHGSLNGYLYAIDDIFIELEPTINNLTYHYSIAYDGKYYKIILDLDQFVDFLPKLKDKISLIRGELPIGRGKYLYPGRLWTISKIISFWSYPSQKEFIQIANDIKNLTAVDILEKGWQIEKIDGSFISTIEYAGEGLRSKEELNKEHELSPMLRKNAKENKGWGAMHPKYQEKEFWKRHKPFENLQNNRFYPRLNE